MGSEIRKKLYKVALNTLELTCFMFPATDAEEMMETAATEPDNKPGFLEISVEFDGAAKGALVLSSSPDLAHSITANMLGVDEVTPTQIENAVSEIANIICGNFVPHFATEKEICFSRPPKLVIDHNNLVQDFENMNKESIQITLDEGWADITIFYNSGLHND